VDPDDALDRHTKVQRSTVQQPLGPLTSRHPIVAGYCKGVWLRAISRATMPAATNIYRSLMFEIERRRLALGFPIEKFSEFAGLSDRYYSKALFADEPSGRQAQWSTLEVMVQALFPHGYELRAKPGAVIDATNLKAKLLQLRAHHDPRSQRELMSELGKKGGRARAVRLSEKRRIAIARRAATKRWRSPK